MLFTMFNLIFSLENHSYFKDESINKQLVNEKSPQAYNKILIFGGG